MNRDNYIIPLRAKYCDFLRQICPRQMECGNGCVPLQTANDSGHKVAHGRNTDYYGQAAEGNPGFPFELAEAEAETEAEAAPNWFDRFGFWLACALTGVAIGIGYGLGRHFNFF